MNKQNIFVVLCKILYNIVLMSIRHEHKTSIYAKQIDKLERLNFVNLNY